MLPDRIFSTFQTASQGMAVQREKIAAASRNIANANTSSPVGSKNVYRPQSVKTLAPNSESFKKVLTDSLSTLKQTHPKHLEGRAAPVSLQEGSQQGMGPSFEIAESNRFRYEYDPNHPDANKEGMVRYPDINMVKEMTELVSANRLYEANLSSIAAEKEIIKRSMQI